MKEIIELISYIPTIVSYVAFGGIFLFTFNFITVKEQRDKTDNFLIACITVSFVIKTILSQILKTIAEDSGKYLLIGCTFSAVIAYLFGLVCNSRRFNNLLLKLGINRTTNGNIWKDIIRPYTWLLVHINGEEYGYLGEVKNVEEHTSAPKIVLKNFSKINIRTGSEIVDYSDDKNRSVLIDTKCADVIEVIYTDYKPPTPELISIIKERVVTFLKK